jgi:signal transduction histidine kinase
VKRIPGPGPAAGTARRAARAAWPALGQVLAGSDAAPASWRRPHPAGPRRARLALIAATLALCVVSLASLHRQLGWPPASFSSPLGLGRAALAAAVAAPLLLAARRPLLGWRAGWLALALVPLVPGAWWGGWPWGPAQVLVLLALFCAAGVRQPRPALWWMWALSLIPWWLWLALDLPNWHGPLGATVVFTITAIAVDSISSRWGAQQALAAQTERTEVEQARRAVLEERTRIARELHDVVAHHMSLIAVQAESAPYRLAGLPEPVSAEFSSLSAAAREALADMRRLLGVLREDQAPQRAPQPQLSDLRALVEAARRAGVPVELSAVPALGQVPSGIAVCAYRIVQESLSNASQHSPGAAVTVSVGRDDGAVRLRVANGPGRAAWPAPRGSGPGHGLTGMRERVALLGGSLSAGPAPDGGFVVSALLPLGAAA